MSAGQIVAAVARAYPSPQYATFYEVRNDAGFHANRSADAVAMSTWPSRGLFFAGFEFKVQRADWRRELANPAKSAPIQRFCAHWWIVTDSMKVVREGELPPTWGLQLLEGGKLAVVRQAPKLEAEPPSLGFIAALLRSANSEQVPKAVLDERVREQVDEQVENRIRQRHDEHKRMHDHYKREFERLEKRVKAFAETSGIDLAQRYVYGPSGDPTKLGAAVKALIETGAPARFDSAFGRARTALEQALASLALASGAMAEVRPAALDEEVRRDLQD